MPDPKLIPNNRGMGGFTSRYGTYQQGYHIVSGFVIIDNRGLVDPVLTSGVTGIREAVYMHELSHAVGLGHASDFYQIMYPIVMVPYARWGNGDITGLYNVGKFPGCLTPIRTTTAAASTPAANSPAATDLKTTVIPD